MLQAPGADDVFIFIIPRSLSKIDWLICQACGLPQFLFEGCCLDPDCHPHTFRVDWGCIHCGFSLSDGADQAGYDVKAGKRMRKIQLLREMQRDALRQYAMAPDAG